MADKAIGATETNEVIDAIETEEVEDELNKLMAADKAINELNELVMADEADITDKPAVADKAKADRANEDDESNSCQGR